MGFTIRRGTVWVVAALLMAGSLLLSNFLSHKQSALPILDSLGGDFSLPATTHDVHKLSHFKGKVVLLNFGFTHCPDVCPTVLSRMKSVLEQGGFSNDELQLIFVTLDPERDSIEKLQPYLAYFDPQLVGLSGSVEDVKKVADLYKVYFVKEQPEADGSYAITHSSHIYLIDGLGRTRATFSNNVSVAEMVEVIRNLIREP